MSVAYADVAEIAFQTGSQQFVKYATLARLSLNSLTINKSLIVNVEIQQDIDQYIYLHYSVRILLRLHRVYKQQLEAGKHYSK